MHPLSGNISYVSRPSLQHPMEKGKPKIFVEVTGIEPACLYDHREAVPIQLQPSYHIAHHSHI